MPISFNSIPQNWKLPLYWVETDPSQAGFPTQRLPSLLIGTMLPAATTDLPNGSTAPANIPVPVGSLADVRELAGYGSMLDNMAEIYLKGNSASELWMLPIAQASGGVAATGTLTVNAAPVDAGTIQVYINGRRVPVGIAAEDVPADIAASIAAAINADPSMPVIATLGGTGSPVVTLTAKWRGVEGNQIDARINYAGTLGAERLPVGLTITASNGGKLSGGTGVVDITAAIAAMGDEPFEFVAFPYTDSTNLQSIEAEYGFSDSGRWGWMRQLYGHVFTAFKDSYANTLTWGPNNNSPHVSALGIEIGSPTPPWEYAAAYAAKAARALLNDPARPLQTLPLDGCKPAPKHQRYTMAEMNALATVGIATQRINGDGVPSIARESTTYQKNLYGQGDDAYEVVPTLATLAALFRSQRHAITSKFPRHKLADDGTRFGPGQAIVTPKSIKAELVAQYRQDEYLGRVENAVAFKKNLIVERDPNDPNRVNVLYPPDLVNQLRVFAVLAQFRLQYNRGVDNLIEGT